MIWYILGAIALLILGAALGIGFAVIVVIEALDQLFRTGRK